MEGEEIKLLKITNFNVENIESNKQFVYKLLRSSDILCLQETWLFNFQLRQLGEMHKSLDGFGEAVNDDNPRTPPPPIQKPRAYGGVATLFRKDMNLKVRKCRDGGCRIVVTEVVLDPLLCIVSVYMPCRNGGATDDFDAILLELQEILDKFSRKTGLSPPPQYFNTDRSKAVLLLWFLTVTCSCCPYLYFGSAIMLVTYFVNFR